LTPTTSQGIPHRLVLLCCLLLLGTGAFARAADTVGRVRVRFDAGWRFRRDPAPAAAGGEAFRWSWRRADVNTLDLPSLPADLEQGDWQPTSPGRDVFRGRRGFVWYRADLGAGAKGQGQALHFEGVDDNAVVYLNGARFMRHEGWDDPFDVPLGQAWKPEGPNLVVVLVQNTDGPGGIMGPVTLESPQPETVPAEVRPDYDDRAPSGPWRMVHLPHDYVVEEPFDQRADTSHGSLPRIPAWYRKTFDLPASYRGKSLWIDFDGVYRSSVVWLNGHKLGEHPGGYTSFRYDITAHANIGGRNVLAVRVDPRRAEGWWYEGGGIYRHVWLNAADPLHVAPWGTFVRATVRGSGEAVKYGSMGVWACGSGGVRSETGSSTPILPSPAGAGTRHTPILFPQGPDAGVLERAAADLTIETTLVNASAQPQTCVLTSRVIDPDGKTVATVRTTQAIPASGSVEVTQTASLASAALWSLETPRLYRLQTTVSRDERTVDRVETPFGIRTIRFDAEKGFFLNGKPVKLKGTCNHQDHAGVGIGVPDSLQEWRIRRLKAMGSNAYRCSHNPPAAELLDACDRLGMLVMDENRHLGDTMSAKTPRGTAATDLSELRSMLLRDRNHPSIIMWSMFNEEGLQGTPEGARIFSAMKELTRRLDPTRPVTEAMNGGWGQGVTLVTDLQGINYGIDRYDPFHRSFPALPVLGSETASTVGTRGIYENDRQRGYVSAYDVNRPGWGATAEGAWKPIADRPFMAGAFVWTGFDYKGEPTPYGWPCINSHFGIMDICGFPKDNYYYYQAWWGEKPVVHLLPHWNWPGKEGQPVRVWCHSNCERVELFLNGKSLGAKEMPRYGHLEWSVPYAPGRLEAKGHRGDRVIASDRVETTGPPAAIRLKSDRMRLVADGEDVTVVEVQVVDAEGRVVPVVDNLVQFSVTGAGQVAGVGNGDPSSHEPDRASQRHVFNGMCMVLVQAGERPGRIVLRATSPGLKGATLELRSAGGSGEE
jgi:beta-galactosidase